MEKLTIAASAVPLFAINEEPPPQENFFYFARHFSAFKHGVIDAGVVGASAENLGLIWVKENQISIATHGHSPFAGEEAKHLGGSSRRELHNHLESFCRCRLYFDRQSQRWS